MGTISIPGFIWFALLQPKWAYFIHHGYRVVTLERNRYNFIHVDKIQTDSKLGKMFSSCEQAASKAQNSDCLG